MAKGQMRSNKEVKKPKKDKVKPVSEASSMTARFQAVQEKAAKAKSK